MKKRYLKVNPIAGATGLYIRFPKEEKKRNLISAQSFNWWLNNEITHYIGEGYTIEYDPQYYDATMKRFI